MRTFVTASVLTLGLGMWGCSGSGNASIGSINQDTSASPPAPAPSY